MVGYAPVFTLSAHIYAGLIPIDAAAFLLKHSHRQPGVCNLNNIGAVFLAVRHYICHRLAEVLLVGSARLCFSVHCYGHAFRYGERGLQLEVKQIRYAAGNAVSTYRHHLCRIIHRLCLSVLIHQFGA